MGVERAEGPSRGPGAAPLAGCQGSALTGVQGQRPWSLSETDSHCVGVGVKALLSGKEDDLVGDDFKFLPGAADDAALFAEAEAV